MRRVEGCLRGTVRPGDSLVLGLSGGLDSIVLLDILDRIARRSQIRLSALHVNHQLSPNASAWERFCRRACRERSIPLRCARVHVAHGDSLEAAARAARYAVLLAQPAEYVVLAHHQDDQAETVLLQLLRGAGIKGLAAMPQLRTEVRGSRIENRPGSAARVAMSERRGPKKVQPPVNPQSADPCPAILRPLLDVPRAAIERYAQRRRLSWVEDESNRDTRFARNFVRHQLLPAMEERFPSCRVTLARSARHMSEAARLLDELAESDAAGACCDAVLAIAVLRQLSPARGRNVLRWFLGRHGVGMPEAGRLDEILRQAISAKDGARVKVALATNDLYRWKEGLYVVPRRQPAVSFKYEWRGERRLNLPELGTVLRMATAQGAGISRAKLAGRPVMLRGRIGGERMQPDCGRPRRTLKNLFQEYGIPPWERDRLPLLCCGTDLVWVPGIGIDCAYRAAPREPSVTPLWSPQGRK